MAQNNTFARHHPHSLSGSLNLGVAGRTAGLSSDAMWQDQGGATAFFCLAERNGRVVSWR